MCFHLPEIPEDGVDFVFVTIVKVNAQQGKQSERLVLQRGE